MPRASRDVVPIFRSAFESPMDEFDTNKGIRPVVFDILAPDQETSLLADGLKLVLHVNPTSMNFSYDKVVERIQTKGGYVEQHWGDGARTISFNMVTGGFKRLYTGLSNITGGGFDTGGTRRETIAYDKYLDMLALFHNNGAHYDPRGQIVFQGIIKVTFDGGIYFGWFTSFQVSEAAEKPYQFDLSAEFTISHEILKLRSFLTPQPDFVQPGSQRSSQASPNAPTQQALEAPRAPAITNQVPTAPEPDRAIDPTLPDIAERQPELFADGGGVLDEITRGDIGGTTEGWQTNPTPELLSDGGGVLDEITREIVDGESV